jgi:hypothetical protein
MTWSNPSIRSSTYLEAVGLAAVTIDRQRPTPQGLDNARPSSGAIRGPKVLKMGAMRTSRPKVRCNVIVTLLLVIAGAWTNGIDASPVGLLLRVMLRVPIGL